MSGDELARTDDERDALELVRELTGGDQLVDAEQRHVVPAARWSVIGSAAS